MPKPIRAILVDDEESSLHILTNLLHRVAPYVEIVALCQNLEEAVTTIKEKSPELVFLDIEMPKYAGYEITSFFDTVDFDLIFVTAYDHYAVKAFEVSAVDYILKPIEVHRLEEAIARYETKAKANNAAVNYEVMMESLAANTVKKLVVPTAHGQQVIDVEDIATIEASRAYCTINMIDGKSYMQSKNLKHFEILLEENKCFFRCHKSWAINTKHLKSYSKSNLSICLNNGQVAKLSKYKKAEFEALVSGEKEVY